ncbi:hypothetical protein J4443_02955 [Candidatus Woesearchaeota archaeon]|nr:hypothetical protein [Candidatus Woesearchaeota archaeon]
MQKKGAIEFSMTTIMVVIIGVAVLALGLAWIRGTFQQVGVLTEQSLDAAETVVGEIGFTGKISAPATITMDRDDAKKFRVLVRNDEKKDSRRFFLTVNDKVTDDCITPSVVSANVIVPAGDTGELLGGLISSGCTGDINALVGINVGKYNAAGTIIEIDEYAVEALAVQVR